MAVIADHLRSLMPDRGFVRHEHYEEVKAELRRAKRQLIDDFSTSVKDRQAYEDAWPFHD